MFLVSSFEGSSVVFGLTAEEDLFTVLEEAASPRGIELSVAVTPTFSSPSSRGEGIIQKKSTYLLNQHSEI
ncbi:hypothetical protein IGI04_019082 [Brassica rapa subsp. trilocularis]|uniref:Uncharacterized protein n=1 Tax=Brassica rapa subsp. trilocularis TaxID=1813537 RepID=A0ABQ7MET3_BRACM|nr:hypothetical protein IGI04_019082 [Brassica rapa subsp. trilocularis]